MSGDEGRKLIATNRRARFDYELLDRFEAGMVLLGPEVKSLRAGKASVEDERRRCRMQCDDARDRVATSDVRVETLREQTHRSRSKLQSLQEIQDGARQGYAVRTLVFRP